MKSLQGKALVDLCFRKLLLPNWRAQGVRHREGTGKQVRGCGCPCQMLDIMESGSSSPEVTSHDNLWLQLGL